MKPKMKPKICEGCLTYDNCTETLMDYNKLTKQCPCIICLIKGVCKISCKEFDENKDSYYSYIKERGILTDHKWR